MQGFYQREQYRDGFAEKVIAKGTPKSRFVALPDISNNVGPVKLFLKTLLSFHLKEFFSFVFLSFSFFSASTTTARL
jgi:hypothetical protein